MLAEVAATGAAIGRDAERAQLLLVPLCVGSRREEQDDLCRGRIAGVDQLADATGDRTRLAAPPVHGAVGIGRLVGDQELDGRSEHRVGKLAGRGERLKLVAEVAAEEVVDDGKNLRPRAVVHRQRQHAVRRVRAPLAEDLHVRVPEPVDRLELVADEEALRAVASDQVDQLALETVRVLELVDHDRAEAQLLACADRVVVAEQIARTQLEILEVQRRLAVFRLLVRRGEGRQQLLQQFAIGRRELVERCLLDRTACFLVGRGTLTTCEEVSEVAQTLRPRVRFEQDEHLRGGVELRLAAARVLRQTTSRLAQFLHARLQLRHVAQFEHELAPGRTQRLVDARQHPAQTVGAVDREQPQPRLVVVRAERRQCSLEGLAAQHAPLALVEDAEARIDACRERVRAQQPVAEAVNRGDPRAVESTREIGAPSLDEPGTDTAPQLARRLLGVGDDEDRLDVDALVADGAGEALDEHTGLPRACARGDEHQSARVDRRALFRVELHARRTRHIGQSWHQVGQSPPFGSCLTSPSRMRSTISTARSRERSTWLQNASSSR